MRGNRGDDLRGALRREADLIAPSPGVLPLVATSRTLPVVLGAAVVLLLAGAGVTVASRQGGGTHSPDSIVAAAPSHSAGPLPSLKPVVRHKRATASAHPTPGASSLAPVPSVSPSAHPTAPAHPKPSPTPKHTTSPKPPVRPSPSARGSDTIVIGNVSSLSGVYQTISQGTQAVVQDWAADVDAAGGLHGHQLKVFGDDDQDDPSTAATETTTQVEKDHVIAFVGNWQPNSAPGTQTYVEKHGIPVVGGDMLASSWTTSPMFFPEGTPQQNLALSAVPRTAGAAPGTGFGLLYCLEAPATCGAAQQEEFAGGGAARAGLNPVYSAAVSETAPSYAAECLAAQQAGVQVLGVAGPSDLLARVMSSCASVNFAPAYSVWEEPFDLIPQRTPDGFLTPLPDVSWTLTGTPATDAFHAFITRHDLPDTSAVLDAWISTQLFAAAVPVSGPVTTASILAGLYALPADALAGLTPPLHFTAGQATPANACYYGARYASGAPVQIGSVPICSS